MAPSHDELVVIDGTALLFRAYFGGLTLAAPDGTPVGAVLAVCQRLVRRLRREQPRHVTVVFDAGMHTFRNDLDPRYKANRGLPPEDLVPQFDLVEQAVEALGFRVFEVPGFEADDICATLASMATRAGMRTRLLSVDKDLCQLVDDAPPGVVMQDPYSDKVLDGAGVLGKLGVSPTQVVDLMALVGDSTDNVPGVRGVGPKTAVGLVRHIGGLDDIYANLDRVAEVPVRGARTLAAKLQAGHAEAQLARQLVALRHDVPLDVDASTLRDRTAWLGPRADADALFDRMGFKGPLTGLRRLAGG